MDSTATLRNGKKRRRASTGGVIKDFSCEIVVLAMTDRASKVAS
jgi:hypothetical protein